MKATIEFALPDEKEDFEDCIKASKMKCALYDISQDIFRKARKHGYDDKNINDLIEKNEYAVELIGLLETKFYEILNNYGVDIV